MTERIQSSDRQGLAKRFIQALRPIVNKIPPDQKIIDRQVSEVKSGECGIDVYRAPGIEFGIVTPTTFENPQEMPSNRHLGQVTARNLVFQPSLND